MNTLEEAWNWYEFTRRNLYRMQRLGGPHWDELPWGGRLGRDDAFRELKQDVVQQECDVSLSQLDDLAIVVLFSVFEAVVRTRVGGEVEREAQGLRHVALQQAAADSLQAIAEGSFFRVLQPYKRMDPDLVEQVNQVRRYRNWVAHGRQGKPLDNVTPTMAYERLDRFLRVLGPEPAETSPAPPTGGGAP